jgi:outer membrane receptor protein involved in Fe transport
MTGNVCARRRQPIARVAGVVALGLVALGAPVGGVAQAPGGSVAGRVADERGAPVPGADVGIVGSTLGARTATSGTYVIENVPAGAHTVRARLIGYRSQTASVRVAAGQRVTQDLTLAADPLNLEAIVVTGTETPRTKLETTNATTVLSAADITRAAPRSTTEALRYVPGFTRVESSGGEVNQNIGVRGILGVEYVLFMEDGLPVFPTMHTYFMNADNLFRMDENIERAEVVRGGSSALYGSNTPGAIINYINRSGGPQVAGSMKLSAATEGLARYDFNLNGPLGNDWRFNFGGFYRYDHGARDPGFPGIRGGQLKASLTRQLPKGYLRTSLKYIDDRNQFILPLPFENASDPRYVPGFSDYGSMNTNEGLDIRVPIPTGELELPLDNGLRTKAYWLTADARFDLGDGWQLQNSAQVMSNAQEWNAITNGDMMPVDTFAVSQVKRLARAGLVDSTVATYELFFTNHFDAFGDREVYNTANGLIALMGEWHVEKPISAFQNQLQIKKTMNRHTFSGAAYFANYTQTNHWFFTDILTDIRDNPRFVDLVVYNVPPDTFEVTKNGFRNFLSNYTNGSGQATIFSGVGGAEVGLTDKLRADLGFRYEWNNYVQSAENTTVRDLDGDSATVYDKEPWGNGSFRHFERTLHEWAGSVGLNYAVNPQLSVYVLGSRAYKMPELDFFLQANALAQVGDLPPKRTNSLEGGVKYASRRWAVTVNGFYTTLKNIVDQGAELDIPTGRTIWVVRPRPENRSYGAEIEASATPTQGVTLLGQATILKAAVDTTIGGSSWPRQSGVPTVLGNLAATYSTGNVTLLGDWHHVGNRFSGEVFLSPRPELPTYSYFNFGASYRVPAQGITVSADVLNAFQSKGLEEGNPRLVTGVRPQFFARPLLPRRVQVSVGYLF